MLSWEQYPNLRLRGVKGGREEGGKSTEEERKRGREEDLTVFDSRKP